MPVRVVREARTVGLESPLIKHQAMRAMSGSSRICRNAQRDHPWIATSFLLKRWGHPCPTSHLDTMKWSRLELLMRTSNGMRSCPVGALLRRDARAVMKQESESSVFTPSTPSTLRSSATFLFLLLFEWKMERLSWVARIVKQQVIWHGSGSWWNGAFLSMSCHPRITHCRRKHHPCIRSKVEERRRTWMGVGLWWKRKAASTTSPWDRNAKSAEPTALFCPTLPTGATHFSTVQSTKSNVLKQSCAKLQSLCV